MEYVRLGSTGMKVSRVCLGMMTYGSRAWRDWILPYDEAAPIVTRAVELGVTFFDTADMYSVGASEEVTGRLLRTLFTNRDDYVLATKVYNPMGEGPNERGLSRKHIMAAIDDSLRRLGTDHVDLYQIHRWDYETPIEETMQALHDVVRAGKARYLGASSMWAWQFAKAQQVAAAAGLTPFVAMQNHYNLVYREEEREMLPLCVDQGVGVIPWSPLARGRLAATGRDTTRARTDEYARRLYDDTDSQVIDAVRTVADARGIPPAQVALAWLLGRPAVVAPIIGASREGHVADAAAAVGVRLTAEEEALLSAPYRPRAVAGHE
ncbi:MAG TPA: aldo/keto reductase [Pilimelia sp.]|nr:aldo/keto reductase [Pilimelia sp.]